MDIILVMELPRRKDPAIYQLNLRVKFDTFSAWKVLREKGIDVATLLRPKVHELLMQAVEQMQKEKDRAG